MARYSIDGQILTDMADTIRTARDLAISSCRFNYQASGVSRDTGEIIPHLRAGQRYKASFTLDGASDGQFRRNNLTIRETKYTGPVIFEGYAYQNETTEFCFTPSTEVMYLNITTSGSNGYINPNPTQIFFEPCDAEGNSIFYYTPEQMLEVMETDLIPASALNITNGKQNIFAYNNWNWFIDQCGDRLNFRTDDGKQLFYGCNKLFNIPFDIHVDCIASNRLEVLNDCFNACVQLEKYPNIYFHSKDKTKIILGKLVTSGLTNMEDQFIFLDDSVSIVGFNYSFLQEYKGSNPPNWLFDGTLNIDWDTMRMDSSTFGCPFPVNMTNTNWLRTMPFFKEFYSTHNSSSEYYHPWYQFTLQNCYSLESIVLPRPGSLALTSNKFSGKTSYLNRMKSFKFDVQEDGTPYTAQWKLQTFDFTNYFGYAYTDSTILNVGFSKENKITNEEQWRAYANGTNPDAWSSSVEYATYGASAARETLATLPDTSGYGTNIIKFKKANASAIPGEHIETNLTAEDIAVAAAKGWTVTLS